MNVGISSNKQTKGKYTGFFIVYSQPNFNEYFDFKIYNSTKIVYNEQINFSMDFVKKIHSQVIKNNIDIRWNINTNDAIYINRYSLPDFNVKFVNISGNFNLTCTIFYRRNTFAQKTLSKSMILKIPSPPTRGKLEVYPIYSLVLSNTRLNLIASNFYYEDNLTKNNFKYEYFYRNIFGEYLWIINKYDNPNQLTRNIMPITDSIMVKCMFGGDISDESHIEAFANITVNLNSLIDYSNIDEIFVFKIEDTILSLEAYSLNLRSHKMAKDIKNNISIKILKKLLEMYTKNQNNTSNKEIIHLNNDKIATILEAISFCFTNYSQISEDFGAIILGTMNIAYENDEINAFNLFYCNNFLRALDNLLKIKSNTNYLSYADFEILEEYKNLTMLSYTEITKGAYKMANLQNINIFGLTVDTKFLKHDIIYINDPTLNPINATSPIFFAHYSDIYLERENTVSKLDALSVTIPSKIIENFDTDFLLIIQQFKKFNKIIDKNKNYTNNIWYPIHSDVIEISFNLIKYNTININEITENRPIEIDETDTNKDNQKKVYENMRDIGFNDESEMAILNFTLEGEFSLKILNYTSCVKIDRETNNENYHIIYDDKCNTWFDYANNLIQCECNSLGYYTVAYNPQFKYSRKHIQFPQTSDSIGI